MKIVSINLASFSPEQQADFKNKVLSLAWDQYPTIGHPELLTVAWDRKEPIEEVFPELAPHLTYQ